MMSWKRYKADKKEWKNFSQILKTELKASNQLEEIIFNSRSKDREKFTLLYRPLELGKE